MSLVSLSPSLPQNYFFTLSVNLEGRFFSLNCPYLHFLRCNELKLTAGLSITNEIPRRENVICPAGAESLPLARSVTGTELYTENGS